MTRASGMLQSMFADQLDKLSRAYELLQEVMPDYFLKHVSEETIHYLLPLLVDIDKKPGVQIVEAPDALLLAYLKDQERNPVNCSALVSGRRVLRTSVHESAPFGSNHAVLVIEEMAKDCPKTAAQPRFSLAILRRAAQLNGKAVPPGFDEAFERLNWNEIHDLTPEKIARRLQLVLQVQCSEFSQVEFEKISSGTWRLTVAVATIARCEGFYAAMLELLARRGYEVQRAYLREFTRSGAETDFEHKAVRVNTFYLQSANNGFRPASLRQLEHELNELCWGMRQDLFETELCRKHDFLYQEVNLFRAAAEFVHSQLAFVDRNAYTPPEVERFMASYPAILHRMCDYFESKFDPKSPRRGEPHTTVLRKIHAMIDEINSGMTAKDDKVRTVLHAVLNFLSHVVKSNFFSDHKTALAFRLEPEFMQDYARSSAYVQAFPPERPYGVFFFWRREICGFQIRFAPLARGGWRTVIPRPAGIPLENDDVELEAQCELFREVYVLAHTQQHKTKDICQGGSRMITLYRGANDHEPLTPGLWAAQRGIFTALLDLINYDEAGQLRDKQVVDLTGAPEIIELGPDENMFDPMIEWMATQAQQAHYSLGAGIISGKGAYGINHKKSGVTSYGLYYYLLHTARYLGLEPERDEFTVKISGGPYGDVAGNLLKLLTEHRGEQYVLPQLRIVAITDALAAIYDPAGVDRRELARLIHQGGLEEFNPKKLHGEGAYLVYNTPESTEEGNLYPAYRIEMGHLVSKKLTQAEFMTLYLKNISHAADIFLPCGGRPRTINAENWSDYLLPGNAPSSRAIIEGANSYLTPEARTQLQNLGVKIIQDFSANKCGVITSSWEVLSNLLLSPPEFAALHDQLVAEIMPRLRQCVEQEAEWLFAEHRRTGQPLTVLSDELANRINKLKARLQTVLHQRPELAFDEIILRHLPPLFRNYRERLAQLPEVYRAAIVAVETALQLAYDRAPYEAVLCQLAGKSAPQR